MVFHACTSCRAWSPPTREAWIEINTHHALSNRDTSPPTREAWIEICAKCQCQAQNWSPPTREAWIEITTLMGNILRALVASHPGGVD